MSGPHPETGASHVLAAVWLDGELAGALDRAAADARDNRANYLRRMIAEHVRMTGHLKPSTGPRRHRGTRRQEPAQ